MRDKGSINVPDGVPVDSVEEGMRLDLLDRKSRLGMGEKTALEEHIRWMLQDDISFASRSPSNHAFGFSTEIDILGDLQVVLPFDDLLISLMRALRAEGRVAWEEW